MRGNSNGVWEDKTMMSYWELLDQLLSDSKDKSTLTVEIDENLVLKMEQEQSQPTSDLKSSLNDPTATHFRTNNIQDYLSFSCHYATHTTPATSYFKSLFQDPQNQRNYLLYKHFKKQNLYLKCGNMYGVDFVAYQSQNPLQHTHSKYLVKIRGEDTTFGDIQALIKVSTSISKTLVLVEVTVKAGESLSEYFTHEIWSSFPRSFETLVTIQSLHMHFSKIK